MILAASDIDYWPCEDCLATEGYKMPDLKTICKQCQHVSNFIKPRKVVNRLPDVDMWMICEDNEVENAKKVLVENFQKYGMHTSDVDPIGTIEEMKKIVEDLERGEMPNNMLPLDIHIIKYSEFANLLDKIQNIIISAKNDASNPYLAIHPISLRKTWQYDDEPYNFVLDFLLSITPFNWEENLMIKFESAKLVIGQCLSTTELELILMSIAPDSVMRRFETKQLKKLFQEG